MLTVFTNGCFDVLHAGHIQFLRRCRQLGTRLVVGVNTDESVARLKGPSRPIMMLADRMEILRSLRYVDQIVSFAQDTPCELIDALRPDIIAKGPGYSEGNMPEAEIVKAYGGRVVILDGPNMSTTQLIERIRRAGVEIQV